MGGGGEGVQHIYGHTGSRNARQRHRCDVPEGVGLHYRALGEWHRREDLRSTWEHNSRWAVLERRALPSPEASEQPLVGLALH